MKHSALGETPVPSLTLLCGAHYHPNQSEHHLHFGTSLSLKPRFAEAILAGTKTVELRRTTPKIEVPTRALLYTSTPVRALLGTCIITSVTSARLSNLLGVVRLHV